MKKLRTLIAAALALGSIGLATLAIASPTTLSRLIELPPGKAAARAGTCSYVDGGWTIIDCSNAVAASSAALNKWSRYVVQCGVDTYLAWGDATGEAADSSDGFAPAKAWVDFVTTDTVRYLSCLNIGSDSDCRIIECL
jgi:hypothetical protein